MLKRLKAGEDPLDLSIEKWKDIVNHLNEIQCVEDFNKELEEGEENCALCEVYGAKDCKDCPVYQRTGKEGCLGTPYSEFKWACIKGMLKDMQRFARWELEFLISLKKQLMEKWN